MMLRSLLMAGLGWLVLTVPAAAETIRVFTSYSQGMMDRFEQGFARVRPDIRVEFQWGHSPDLFATLRGPDQGGVDVVWTPASGAFPVLAREEAFQPLGDLADGVERKVGGMALGDAEGTYTAFEIAAYGFVVRPDYLARTGLAAPATWDDLARPAYAGHLVLPVPATVGFAPAMIEIPLQHKGWERGWALWAEIAANAELMGGGGGVAMINELAEGAKGIGMVMDFFVRGARAEGKPVAFIHPDVTAFNPAHVAVTAKAPHGEAARAFVRYVLSEDGQRLLMSPEAMRLPVRKALYAEASAEFPRPFEGRMAAFGYDPHKAIARKEVLKALFDEYVTRRHDRLKELFAAIHAAEAEGRTAAAQAARAEATRLPIGEAAAMDPAVNKALEQPESEAAQAVRNAWAREIAVATDRAFAALAR